jgi:hypothetical protein
MAITITLGAATINVLDIGSIEAPFREWLAIEAGRFPELRAR